MIHLSKPFWVLNCMQVFIYSVRAKIECMKKLQAWALLRSRFYTQVELWCEHVLDFFLQEGRNLRERREKSVSKQQPNDGAKSLNVWEVFLIKIIFFSKLKLDGALSSRILILSTSKSFAWQSFSKLRWKLREKEIGLVGCTQCNLYYHKTKWDA